MTIITIKNNYTFYAFRKLIFYIAVVKLKHFILRILFHRTELEYFSFNKSYFNFAVITIVLQMFHWALHQTFSLYLFCSFIIPDLFHSVTI